MRGAVVGLGVIGEGHLQGYLQRSDLHIVAVVDPLGKRGAVASAMDVPCFASLPELLDAMPIDFVDICSPPNTHLDLVELAVDRGLHVMCEKPMLHDERQLVRLCAILDRATTIVFPSHNYRFAPGILRLRDAVRDAAFGDITRLHFRTLRTRNARGVADWNPDWRRDAAVSGGGILRDHGPHSFYVMRFVTGLVPVSVSCMTGDTGAGPTVPVDGVRVEDTVLARIRFADGAEAQLDLTWASQHRQTTYEVIGSRQTARLVDDQVSVAGPVGSDNSSELVRSDFNDVTHGAWFGALLGEFAAASSGNSAELRATYAARAVTEVQDVAAAYRSARAGGLWTSLLSDGYAAHVPSPQPAMGGGRPR